MIGSGQFCSGKTQERERKVDGTSGANAGNGLPIELCYPSRFISIVEKNGSISLSKLPDFGAWQIEELVRAISSVFAVEYVRFCASSMRVDFKLARYESHRVIRYIVTYIMRAIYAAKDGAVLLFSRAELDKAHDRATDGHVCRKPSSGARRYKSWGKPDPVIVDSNNYAV
jgi:hypothetical protein